MPWDIPERETRLTAALTKAVEDCGATQWAQAPGWLLGRYLAACYDAFVHGANERHRWMHCRERDPHWPPPPYRPEPQG